MARCIYAGQSLSHGLAAFFSRILLVSHRHEPHDQVRLIDKHTNIFPS